MSTKITAIVLNYRHRKDSCECISALKKSDLGEKIDFILVDNSPTPYNKKFFKRKFIGINYIPSSKNLGFAGGNNQGIKEALNKKAEYILIINPDVTVSKKFFTPLLKNFTDNKVGIVAPAISHKQKDGIYFGFEGKVDWSLAKPEHRNLKKNDSLKQVKAEFVTFACVIISANTFKKAGLLDDKYFMYFEDVDYCLTAGRKGIKSILDPSVVVEHRTSSSFSRPTGKLLISFKSHLRFINKWLRGSKKIKPFVNALLLYPYLYVLWTYHYYKYGR